MAPKPLLSLLKKYLVVCLMNGTSITESGITVSTDKLPGEIIYFFRIDSDAGRKQLEMENSRCCDCLIFYAKETEQEEMLCFLELKAAGLENAKEQIIEAHRKMKLLLATNHIQRVTLKAFICMRHQVPPGDLKHLKKLKDAFGGNVKIKVVAKQYKELGEEFLRR